jgi:hypothetical protein
MNTEDFLELKSFKVHKGQVLIPNQVETAEWLELEKHDAQVYMKLVQARDLGMHRGYFMILNHIYKRLPLKFRQRVPQKSFYKFVKTLANEYKEVYQFKDGRTMIEYDSISFGKMNQKRFKEYVSNQLSIIYEEILIPFEMGYLMDEVNEMFEKLLAKFY